METIGGKYFIQGLSKNRMDPGVQMKYNGIAFNLVSFKLSLFFGKRSAKMLKDWFRC